MWQIKEFDYNRQDKLVDFLNKNKGIITNVSMTYQSMGMKYIILYYTENITDIRE